MALHSGTLGKKMSGKKTPSRAAAWLGALAALWVVMRNLHLLWPTPRLGAGPTLLLTAHPDDETMFFTPLLAAHRPFVLCLSDGNMDGLGGARRAEMGRLCASAGVEHEILGYEDGARWSPVDIAIDLARYIAKRKVRWVATFGPRGVSGHRNHVACHRAVKLLEALARADRSLPIGFRYLRDWPLFQKYVFLLSRPSIVLRGLAFEGLRNMLFYRTQMVWFRCLYCLFSNYMHANAFEEVC